MPINTRPHTFEEWKESALAVDAIAERVHKMKLERIRKLARVAGIDTQYPGCHAHNALCSLENGKPWPGVNYSIVRKIRRLDRDFSAGRLARSISRKAWDHYIRSETGDDLDS